MKYFIIIVITFILLFNIVFVKCGHGWHGGGGGGHGPIIIKSGGGGKYGYKYGKGDIIIIGGSHGGGGGHHVEEKVEYVPIPIYIPQHKEHSEPKHIYHIIKDEPKYKSFPVHQAKFVEAHHGHEDYGHYGKGW